MSVKKERPYFWQPVPEHLQQAQAEQFFLTPAQRAELNVLASQEWFLVRNEIGAVVGGDPRCRRCGAIHEYITTGCVELPFNSLRELSIFVGRMPETAQQLFRSMLRPGTLTEPGTIVPITQADAARLNERIRSKRMLTIMEQRPVRRGEIDAETIERRIVSKALSLRDGKVRR
jgi:hypothetical protein